MAITYEWIFSSFIIKNDYYDNLIRDCSILYSTQYGKWSSTSLKAGDNIKLSPQRIRELLKSKNSALYWAKDGSELVGYAIALQLDVPKYGVISWVTQLVVHENYRHNDIAKSLLHSIWGFTDNFAWGIVSANPYAVRALEKTTRRRSDPNRINHNLRKIITIGIEHLPYINEHIETIVTSEFSKINTEFFVDHSSLDEMISNVVTDTVPWTLGSLEEGWEWLAFTFRDQLPFSLSEVEIDFLLKTSDNVVQNAYRRMDLSSSHKWAMNTESEVDFIMNECDLLRDDILMDFGCGQGRHSIELARRGVSIVGVDYVDRNIDEAIKQKELRRLGNIEFMLGDCRDIIIEKKAKAIICLYDVIGTYADNVENIKVIRNIYSHLNDGGIALITVMNYELTLSQAKNKFVLRENPNALLSLCPSNIMENSGNVFDPDYYLIDTETGVAYRREQFKKGRSLPIELIVRDKRFSKREIEKMCEFVGFEIVFSRYVSARNWEVELEPKNKSAKEILLKCRKIPSDT